MWLLRWTQHVYVLHSILLVPRTPFSGSFKFVATLSSGDTVCQSQHSFCPRRTGHRQLAACSKPHSSLADNRLVMGNLTYHRGAGPVDESQAQNLLPASARLRRQHGASFALFVRLYEHALVACKPCVSAPGSHEVHSVRYPMDTRSKYYYHIWTHQRDSTTSLANDSDSLRQSRNWSTLSSIMGPPFPRQNHHG